MCHGRFENSTILIDAFRILWMNRSTSGQINLVSNHFILLFVGCLSVSINLSNFFKWEFEAYTYTHVRLLTSNGHLLDPSGVAIVYAGSNRPIHLHGMTIIFACKYWNIVKSMKDKADKSCLHKMCDGFFFIDSIINTTEQGVNILQKIKSNSSGVFLKLS